MQGRARRLDDYRAPDGVVPDSGARDSGALLRTSIAAGPGRLRFGWQADSARDIGKPSADHPAVRSFYPREDSGRLTLGWEMAPREAFTHAAVEAFFGSYRLVTDRERAATPTDPRTLSRADVEANDYGLRASARRAAGAGRIEFGLDRFGRIGLQAADATVTYDAGGAIAGLAVVESVEDARRDDTGLFVTADAPFGGRFTATGGLRLQEVRTRNRGGFAGDRDTRHDAVAGHAALTVSLGRGWSAVIQAARGFREPTLSDRYFRGTTGRGFVTGNPDLEPERSLQADLALRFSPAPRLRGAIYAYRYRIDDLVERYEAAPDEFTFRNRGRALLRGIELEIEGETRGGLSIAFGGQVARGEALDDGAPLADVPAAGGFVTLRRAVRERGHLTARLAGFLRDRRPGPTEIDTPGHTLLDLGGGWRFRSGLEIRLLVRNALDRSYPGSPDEAAAPAPGRTALLTFAGAF
jgi:iron complex outermembrane receptor protein